MLELTCIYKKLWNGVVKDNKFYSFEVFGKWVADISIIDVIQEEE